MVALPQLTVVSGRDADEIRKPARRALAKLALVDSRLATPIELDRQDELGAMQFANCDAWMTDTSYWDDLQEAYLEANPKEEEAMKANPNGTSAKPAAVIEALLATDVSISGEQIAERTDINRHTVNYHLKRLFLKGTIKRERVGKVMFYQAAGESVRILSKSEKDRIDKITVPVPPAVATAAEPAAPAGLPGWQRELRYLAKWEGMSLADFVTLLIADYRATRK